MSWVDLIQFVIQEAPEGINLVESLFSKWSSGTPPTQADWDSLRAMATQTAVDRMTEQLTAAGIPLDDPHAVSLLALARTAIVPAPVPTPAPVPEPSVPPAAPAA